MKFLIKLNLLFFATNVGKDKYKNKYYFKKGPSGNEKRFVIFKGSPEASKVPPQWDAWLRFSTKLKGNTKLHSKNYTPNLTGTSIAYHYKGCPSNKLKCHSSWNED